MFRSVNPCSLNPSLLSGRCEQSHRQRLGLYTVYRSVAALLGVCQKCGLSVGELDRAMLWCGVGDVNRATGRGWDCPGIICIPTNGLKYYYSKAWPTTTREISKSKKIYSLKKNFTEVNLYNRRKNTIMSEFVFSVILII